jgi:Holliday junction resolvase
LEKRGWFVARQSRSSLPDLIALKDGMILLVECKLGGYMPPRDRRHLISLARRRTGGKAILAFRRGTDLLLKEISTKWSKFDRPFDLEFPKYGMKNGWSRA